MDVLSIVSNVQQVPPEELEASQEMTQSSKRFAFSRGDSSIIISMRVAVLVVLKLSLLYGT